MQTRTITLRLAVRSRDFRKRRAALDRAVVMALEQAIAELEARGGFVVTESLAEVADEVVNGG